MRLSVFLKALIIAALLLLAPSAILAEEAPRLRVLNVSSAQTIGMQLEGRNIIVPQQGRFSDVLTLNVGDNMVRFTFRSGSSFGSSFFGIRAAAGERYLIILYGRSDYVLVNERELLSRASDMAHVLLIHGAIGTETITVSLKDGAGVERYRSILTTKKAPVGALTLSHSAITPLFITPSNYVISSTAGNATAQANLMGNRIFLIIVSGRNITVVENN
jgi:hypothetical protein